MQFEDKWQPLLQQAGEESGADAGGDVGSEGAPPPSGPGSGRSELRQQLERNFEQDRKASDREPAPKGRSRAPKRVAGGADLNEQADKGLKTAAGEGEAPAEGEQAPEPETPAEQPPDGFSREAKAEWANTPQPVRAAIVKREADMAKGVEQLRGYYRDIDQALAPHIQAIQQHGHTPAQAVAQLFAWFQALASNPQVAFPALVKSFNQDPARLFQLQAQAQQAQPQAATQGQQPAGQVDPQVQRYINDLQGRLQMMEQSFTQKLGGLENTFAQQSQAKTEEILNNWAKDKPYFQEVRQMMANLVASNAIPLKDGQVDLDAAYDAAMYAIPDVRGKVLAAQAEERRKAAAAKADAERKAQQEQADKARRAAVSVGGGAPGVPGAPQAKGSARKSVRESINEAVTQLRE